MCMHVGIYLPPPFPVTGAIRREKDPQPVMYSCAIFWCEIWEFGMSLRDAELSGGGEILDLLLRTASRH